MRRRPESLECGVGSTPTSLEQAQGENSQQPKPRTKKPSFPTSAELQLAEGKLEPQYRTTSWNPSQSPLPLQQHEAYGTVPEARGTNNSNIYSEQFNSRQIVTPPGSFFYQLCVTPSEVYSHQSSFSSPQPLHHNAFRRIPSSQNGEMLGHVASTACLDMSVSDLPQYGQQNTSK